MIATAAVLAKRGEELTMFELFLCAIVTVLPDYLYRRLVQGRRFGKEITFLSAWFELRWGIIACLVLTVSLITLTTYFHPFGSNAKLAFRSAQAGSDASLQIAKPSTGTNATGSEPVLHATFHEIEAQIIKIGMVAEAACSSRPWTIIPMVITELQYDEQQAGSEAIPLQSGIRATMEPLYVDGLKGIETDGSCIVVAYTSNHEDIPAREISLARRSMLHGLDATAFLRASLLRVQALTLSARALLPRLGSPL
jgi:hypothetical protein